MTHGHHHHHEHAHGHDHEHAHEHDHEHDHEHVQTDPESHRTPLAAGAGRGGVLFLDAFSGVAGDMSIAALVDLGVPFDVVGDAVDALGLDGVELVLESAFAGAIGATRFDVRVLSAQGERTWSEIDALIAGSALADDVKTLARRIFRRLGEAEAGVHRIPIEEVHFHEVGAVDAIVDIVGAAACFRYIDADEVVCSALPMGRGTVECRHGILPLPAPATVACLRGVPTTDAGIEAELVTPTGAAIVATVADRFAAWPDLAPDRIGWGRGTRDLPDRPNALRAILGHVPEPRRTDIQTHEIIEANVDDMTGELAAHAIEALLSAGALDAWASPVTMKKGRPGLVIAALSTTGAADRIAETMLRETSSIGVRRTAASRVERPRSVVDVHTRFGAIPVKVSGGPYGAPQVKPEFDACARAAASAGVPVREVIAEALRAFNPDVRE